jgi:hypothetical protein
LACHHKAHGEPEKFRDFILDRIGEDAFYELRRLAYTGDKQDNGGRMKIKDDIVCIDIIAGVVEAFEACGTSMDFKSFYNFVCGLGISMVLGEIDEAKQDAKRRLRI